MQTLRIPNPIPPLPLATGIFLPNLQMMSVDCSWSTLDASNAANSMRVTALINALRRSLEKATAQDAQRAKSANAAKPGASNQINTVASIAEVPANQTDDFIAAVFPSLSSNVVGDGSFADGSDSSFASLLFP
jgi:hypothetical protein